MNRATLCSLLLVCRLAAATPNPPAAGASEAAQALVTEGANRVRAKQYDQALANFLEAYARQPDPRILLHIASTLREMGRLSDAANTYQRYLLDPGVGAERIGEVKEVLTALDQVLTVLTIRVSPAAASVAIDAGPFIPVAGSLQARVRPGIHLVRVRHGEHMQEVTVNGFAGEVKEVPVSLPDAAPPSPTDATPTTHAWLDDSQRYGVVDPTSNQRAVLDEPGGVALPPFVPNLRRDTVLPLVAPPRETISSGVIAVVRIDAEGRGFAGGFGLALSRGHFEADVLVLRSNQTGAYLGGRYRFLTGFFRPYVAAGVPGFVFDHQPQMTGPTETRVALGLRGAGGLELFINGHLSVQADVGYERFWFVDGTRFVDSVWVPTVGAIGRL